MPKTYKIVQINTVADGPSPVAGVMNAITRHLSANNFDVSTIAGYTVTGQTPPAALMQTHMQHRMAALAFRLSGKEPTAPTRRLTHRLDSLRPDLVVVHNTHGYYLDCGLLARWCHDNRTPMVMIMHDHRLLTGRCAAPGQCMAWADGDCDKCRHRSLYPAVWRRTAPIYPCRFLRQYDITYVAVSQYLKDRAASVGIEATVIHNGVDTDIFAPQPTAVKDFLMMAAANRWTANKNLEGVINAFQSVRQPGDRLCIVGRGAKGHKSVTALGDSVTVIADSLTPRQMSELYNRSRLLVSAAHGEAFGMTVAEALACGTPVLLNSGVGASSLIGSGGGMTADFDNRSQLHDAALTALTMKPSAETVTDTRRMAGQYAQLFRDIMNKNHQTK